MRFRAAEGEEVREWICEQHDDAGDDERHLQRLPEEPEVDAAVQQVPPPASVERWCPGTIESASTLYAPTIAMGMMKNAASHASGRPSSPGVARSRRGRLAGLHLFLEPRVERTARNVAVDVSVRLLHRFRIRELSTLQEVTDVAARTVFASHVLHRCEREHLRAI